MDNQKPKIGRLIAWLSGSALALLLFVGCVYPPPPAYHHGPRHGYYQRGYYGAWYNRPYRHHRAHWGHRRWIRGHYNRHGRWVGGRWRRRR